MEGHVHTNGLENFWNLLKRSLGGTYVSVDPDHLGAYVAEQVYRFNNRKADDQFRFTLALGSVAGRRLGYRQLIARPEGTGPRRGG